MFKKLFGAITGGIMGIFAKLGGDDAVIKFVVRFLASKFKKDVQLRVALISFDDNKTLMNISKDAALATSGTGDDVIVEKIKEVKDGLKAAVKSIDSDSLKHVLLDGFVINGKPLGDLTVPDLTPSDDSDNFMVRTLLQYFLAEIKKV